MSFVVSALDRFSIRRVDETKGRRAHLIEPVGPKLDVVLILERKIFLVRARNRMSSCAFDVMVIHIRQAYCESFRSLVWAEIVSETVSTIKEGLRRGHLVKSFLAGYLETIRYFKSRKSEALKKNDPEQVGRSSDRRERLGGYMRSLPDDGRPTSKGLEVVLDALAKEDPKAKSLAVAQLLDLRYLP